MHGFTKFFYLLITEAPGAYQPEKVALDRTPAYSFGVKVNRKKVNDTPGKIQSGFIQSRFVVEVMHDFNCCVFSLFNKKLLEHTLLRR